MKSEAERFNPWPLTIIGALCAIGVLNAVLFAAAYSTRVDLIDPRPFESGEAYGSVIAERTAFAASGWKCAARLMRQGDDSAVLEVVLRDRGGKAIDHADVQIDAKRPVSAASDFSGPAKADVRGEGVYSVILPSAKNGLWLLWIHIASEDQKMLVETQVVL